MERLDAAEYQKLLDIYNQQAEELQAQREAQVNSTLDALERLLSLLHPK